MSRLSTESDFSTEDHRWMQHALQLALRGLGAVEPNPLVGCVLVRDGVLIGSGHHAKFGGPHAERVAVAAARDAGKGLLLDGCTAYVTLEPCCHQGKTPPCTNLLLEVGVKRVVVAMLDPFAAVNGQGLQQLRSAGVRVDVGVEGEAARVMNAAYIKRLQTGRPWVIGKWAMSLDGRIATSTGHSQWISSEASREYVHLLRGQVDAIIVGRGTAEADDPLLTARPADHSTPLRTAVRVVVDSNLSLSPSSKLALSANQYPTLVWAGPSACSQKRERLESLGVQVECCDALDSALRLDRLLQYLVSQYSATNVLVEGGGQLLGSLFDLKQIDQCEVFIAPKLIGGSAALSPLGGVGVSKVTDGPACDSISWQQRGVDQHFSCRLRWG